MFVFEGKCSLVTPDATTRFMFHVDKEARQLRIQVNEGNPDTRSFEAWAELFKGFFPAPQGLLAAFAEPPPGSANVAQLAKLAGIEAGLHDRLRLRFDAPGVTAIQASRRCEAADFSPQGNTVVDFGGIDFSGVHFVDTDFSKATLHGANLSGCSFERCTFARNQLSGQRLAGADFTRQMLRDLDLGGAKLDGARLDGTYVIGCHLRGASLQNASVSRTFFALSNLTLATLDGMTGTRPKFIDCDFTLASLRKVALVGPVFGGSQLVSVEAAEASLVEARFGYKTLEDIVDLPRGPVGANAEPIDSPATILTADFSRATLTGARFDGASITQSKFDAAKMQKAIFGGTTLRWVSFKDAELAGADFAARDAEYSEGHRMREPVPVASFDGVDFDNANLHAANFRGAVLADKVSHARVPRRDTSKSERLCLAGARFRSGLLGLDWSYVDASNATIVLDRPGDETLRNFRAKGAILPVVDFAGLALVGADFEAADLRGMRFGNCNLENARFNRAILEAADFTGAYLQDAHFDHATLMNANFSDTWMRGAIFNGAVLTEANFSSAMLAEVDFKGISDGRLSNVNFSGACLVSATFTNIKAPRSGNKQTNFSSACLAGADFVGASLTDVVLTRAQLSSKEGSIKVVHRLYPGGEQFDYDPTLLDTRSTGPQTTCPDGRGGMCTTQQLHAVPVPVRWPPGSA